MYVCVNIVLDDCRYLVQVEIIFKNAEFSTIMLSLRSKELPIVQYIIDTTFIEEFSAIIITNVDYLLDILLGYYIGIINL